MGGMEILPDIHTMDQTTTHSMERTTTSAMDRTATRLSQASGAQLSCRRPLLTNLATAHPLSLPYREVTKDANLDEYLHETAQGVILTKIITRLTGKLEEHKLVTFTIGDPENPKNWSKGHWWYCTMVVAAFASGVITPRVREIYVSNEVSLLTITLFVTGFGVGGFSKRLLLHASFPSSIADAAFLTGPMIFAPLSEIIGRRIVYTATLLVAVVFIIPYVVADNIATLLVCRAIDGIAFSAPMTLVGGILSDLWPNEERGVPMAAFSAAPFVGPAVGPLVGGFLSDAAGWRWLYWIQLIVAAPTLLLRRAARLRKEENDPLVYD